MKEEKPSNESKKEASQNREEHQKGVLLQKPASYQLGEWQLHH